MIDLDMWNNNYTIKEIIKKKKIGIGIKNDFENEK